MIIIREAVPEDTADIADLIVGVIKELYGREPHNKNDYDNFQKFYRDRNGICYVADVDGRIVGSAAVMGITKDTAKFRRLYVHKEFRRTGIATQLMEKRLAFCKKKGYHRIILCTYPQKMKAASLLFKKFGFKQYGTAEDGILMEKIYSSSGE